MGVFKWKHFVKSLTKSVALWGYKLPDFRLHVDWNNLTKNMIKGYQVLAVSSHQLHHAAITCILGATICQPIIRVFLVNPHERDQKWLKQEPTLPRFYMGYKWKWWDQIIVAYTCYVLFGCLIWGYRNIWLLERKTFLNDSSYVDTAKLNWALLLLTTPVSNFRLHLPRL